jgi:hypothetical protein
MAAPLGLGLVAHRDMTRHTLNLHDVYSTFDGVGLAGCI